MHDLAKLSTLKAFHGTETFDFICLSESYLDSVISLGNSSLSLDFYKLIYSENPKEIKQGGVCIYNTETLPVKTIQINYLHECLVCEVNFEKKIYIVTLYWSHNKTDDEFNEFLHSFESVIDNINQSNPYFVLITWDFNTIKPSHFFPCNFYERRN